MPCKCSQAPGILGPARCRLGFRGAAGKQSRERGAGSTGELKTPRVKGTWRGEEHKRVINNSLMMPGWGNPELRSGEMGMVRGEHGVHCLVFIPVPRWREILWHSACSQSVSFIPVFLPVPSLLHPCPSSLSSSLSHPCPVPVLHP